MSKFKVTIEETISQTFYVEADSVNAAIDLAEARYKAGDIVVESGEVHSTIASVVNPDAYESTIWKQII